MSKTNQQRLMETDYNLMVTRGKGRGTYKGKWVTGGNLNLGGRHTTQFTFELLLNHIFETYIILLTNVISIIFF